MPFTAYADEEDCTSVYADDTVVTITARDHDELEKKLESKYAKVAEFMLSQGLKLNDDKSHLLIITTGMTRTGAEAAMKTELKTPEDTIKPSKTEKFLGGYVQSNLKWDEHIILNEENLCKSLNRRCNALSKISCVSSFKSRKMFANGLFMGKLSYIISLWGGTTKENINALQTIQNKAARISTRDWDNSTAANLGQLGWLSVNQLIFYHSVLQMFKLRESRRVGGPPAPRYLANMFTWEYNYNTRQAEAGVVRPIGIPRLDITRKSFRYRAAEMFNKLPIEMMSYSSITMFKTAVKSWIVGNIPIRP